MTTDEKLEILKRAIELGADVKFNLHDVGKKEDAIQLCRNFPMKPRVRSYKNTHWLHLGKQDFEGCIFYNGESNDES